MSRRDKQIRIPDDVLYQHLGRETVLLHSTTEIYYGLDEVGSRVWQLLKEYGQTEPVIAALVEEYDVDEATLRSDIDRLLDELASADLVQVRDGTGF